MLRAIEEKTHYSKVQGAFWRIFEPAGSSEKIQTTVGLHLLFWNGTVFSQQLDDRNPKAQSIHFKIFESRLCTVKARLPFARQVTCPQNGMNKEASPGAPGNLRETSKCGIVQRPLDVKSFLVGSQNRWSRTTTTNIPAAGLPLSQCIHVPSFPVSCFSTSPPTYKNTSIESRFQKNWTRYLRKPDVWK